MASLGPNELIDLFISTFQCNLKKMVCLVLRFIYYKRIQSTIDDIIFSDDSFIID